MVLFGTRQRAGPNSMYVSIGNILKTLKLCRQTEQFGCAGIISMGEVMSCCFCFCSRILFTTDFRSLKFAD